MKIFIVEDDKMIAREIEEELISWGFVTQVAEKFENIWDEFLESGAELVLMDISLPSFNGFYWCSKIREASNVPIIFLSSRGEDASIIQGMQFGGDDYLVKPISLPVLVAKVKAMLRRSYDFKEETDFLEYKGVKLYLSYHRLEKGEKSVPLTKTEKMILEVLFKDQGAVSKRDTLMDRCWQEEQFIDDNTLAVNMNRIRKKMAEIGCPNLIQTKKGIGYYLYE